MADKNNANIGFEKQIWDAACVLWGHIPAAEYRQVIVGLIFLRYISSAFEKKYRDLVAEGDGFEDDRDAYEADGIFFVPPEARWETIASAAHKPEIGTVIDTAMRAIETENKSLKNVLPKNFGNPDLDKKILGDVVDIFTNSMLTNEEVIQELLKIAKDIANAKEAGTELGLSDEEMAFYDALTKPEGIKEAYNNDQFIALTKELTDTLRKNQTIDWQKKEQARAKMRLLIKKLLKKYDYPPKDRADAVIIVMQQCELWADKVMMN